jgi:pimeloyl-ACP methyl ester carboxylesterase
MLRLSGPYDVLIVGDTLRFATARLSTGPGIHYAEQGDPGGEPILFLHGWPDSWYSYSRVLERLPAGVHAVVPDQRGFGDSDRPESGYRIDDFAEDAAALLDALAIERATVVGHSFGSFVARRLAIAHPERVTRLVLIATGVFAGTPVVRDAHAALQDLPDPVPERFARDFQASTIFSTVPTEFFDRIVAESMKLPARLWRAVLDGLLAYADEEALSGVSAPTRLIWGVHDALFPREHQDPLVDAIRGATLTVYPETGHCPNWERPDRVATDLQAFLGERR